MTGSSMNEATERQWYDWRPTGVFGWIVWLYAASLIGFALGLIVSGLVVR